MTSVAPAVPTPLPLIELRHATKRFVKSLDVAAKIGRKLGANVREEIVHAVDNVDLAVFAGEFTVEAAEQVCRMDELSSDFLDALQSLL